MSASLAESLASLPEAEREAILAGLSDADLGELEYDWKFWGRPEQFAPPGDWANWLALAGRGFGKTRLGAEFVREEVASGRATRIALIAETAADARDVMVEGPSGILACHPPALRPDYEPSKRRLTWPNGTVATLFNAVEPDQLRGPQFDLAWCDELAKWRYADETWDQLAFGLRLGKNPRACITTTPRPIPLVRKLIAESRTVVTRGSTFDNRANLAATFIESIRARYEGTRLGRQELNAEILDDVPGALWTRAMIDAARLGPPAGDMRRVIVAIDPSGTKGEADDGDEIGIVVAGVGLDGRGYVLADYSCKASPEQWARRAIDAYRRHAADRIVAERNFGGAMVETVIRAVDRTVAYAEVVASRGKVQRAEPVAALYEQGRVSHAAGLEQLEDQMVAMTAGGYLGDGSPDRVDAAVWALTDLMLAEAMSTMDVL